MARKRRRNAWGSIRNPQGADFFQCRIRLLPGHAFIVGSIEQIQTLQGQQAGMFSGEHMNLRFDQAQLEAFPFADRFRNG